MFVVTEEVAGFRFEQAVRDAYVHLMVIREFRYESYCYAQSLCWTPTTALSPTCPRCMRAVITHDDRGAGKAGQGTAEEA